MSFFRSEPMTLCQIVLHTESAFNCLIILGYHGKVQFRNIYDGHPTVNEQFTAEVRRCQELQRILSYFQQEMVENNIKKIIYPDVDEDDIPEADNLKKIESAVEQIYEDLIQISNSVQVLIKQRLQMFESLQVLQKADVFFGAKAQGAQALMAWSDSVTKILMKNELHDEISDGVHLSFFSGTIPVEKFHTFERLLWRVTKGFFYMKHDEFFPTTEEKKKIFCKEFTRKYVFLVFFMGQELRKKLAKICQGFGIKIFECPESLHERRAEKEKLKTEIYDLDIVIERTQQHRIDLLLLASSDLFIWQVKTNKILMTYYLLNRMSRVRHLHTDKYLQAECWIPTKEIPSVRRALEFGVRRTAKGTSEATFPPLLNEINRRHVNDLDKPTYFKLNKFTQGFQHLVDSYGIAQYQELNPAPYTIITFPFLFAVMFGDMGHGFIMFLFGLWLICNEKSLEEKNRLSATQNEIFNILFAGRYIVTLMGAFSIYTGLIYNDCFSKAFNIFASSWRIDINETMATDSPKIQLDPNNPQIYLGTPYILGMDPVWDAAGDTAIITYNSLKMKLAIILGVSQMIFGLILSAVNYINKKEYVNLILVFLPQITFLLCIFFYLVFLIFFKWVQYGGHIKTPFNSACAPSVLIMFINMLMMKAPDEPPPGCEVWMFDEQPYFEACFLALALICVPVLLAGKPIYFMIQQKKIQKIKNLQLKHTRSRMAGKSIRKSLLYNVDSSMNNVRSFAKTGGHENETILSELWIHSGIHCIESVLGSVSHTASYLRLWALSLAHEQLSTVLWNMVLGVPFRSKHGYWNSLILYMIFIIWSTLTVAILIVMEGLSAFLHTLRLHWVEFQSKFYDGSGEAFQPFRFVKSSVTNTN